MLALSTPTRIAQPPKHVPDKSNPPGTRPSGIEVGSLAWLLGWGLPPGAMQGMQVQADSHYQGMVDHALSCAQQDTEPARPVFSTPSATAQLRYDTYLQLVQAFGATVRAMLPALSSKQAFYLREQALRLLLRPPVHSGQPGLMQSVENHSIAEIFHCRPERLAWLLQQAGHRTWQATGWESQGGDAAEARLRAGNDFCDYVDECIARLEDFRDDTGLRPMAVTPEQMHQIRLCAIQSAATKGAQRRYRQQR